MATPESVVVGLAYHRVDQAVRVGSPPTLHGPDRTVGLASSDAEQRLGRSAMRPIRLAALSLALLTVVPGASGASGALGADRTRSRLRTFGRIRGKSTIVTYLALLDPVLEDREVTKAERDALDLFAATFGITRTSARELHQAYLGDMWRLAQADGVVTPDQHADLQATTVLLDVVLPR